MNIRIALIGLLMSAALAGCGFQPIYMPTASGNPGVAQRELAAVNVALIPDRPGQLLRQALQDRFGSDGGMAHRYDLQVSFGISGEGVAILPDTTPTRIRLIGNATWVLIAQDAGKTRLASGSARAVDAFNTFNTQYFAIDLSNEQVQRRLASAVADQVATQLAVWFRQRAAKPAQG